MPDGGGGRGDLFQAGVWSQVDGGAESSSLVGSGGLSTMTELGVGAGVQTRLRAAMPVAQRWAYFDHAAIGPLTRAAAEAMGGYAAQASESGDVNWLEWSAGVERTRAAAAQLIGALPAEVALVHSTSEGISLVAEGLDWQSGDNVVLPAGEFPANIYPWLHLQSRGVEVRQVPMPTPALDYQRLADACDARTRLITCSWVGYATGYRCDPSLVGQIAKQKGTFFLLDAIQGLGVFPLDVRRAGIDFLSADGHKWLLGPEGAGLAYIRDELLERLRPPMVGWNSVIARYDFHAVDPTLRPEAARYEIGAQNMIGQLGFGGSLQTLLDLGLSPTSWAVAEPVLASVDRLAVELQRRGAVVSLPPADLRSGIVMFDLPGHDPVAIRQHLLERGIVTSCRGGRVRVAVHAYNDESDFQQLYQAIEESRS